MEAPLRPTVVTLPRHGCHSLISNSNRAIITYHAPLHDAYIGAH